MLESLWDVPVLDAHTHLTSGKLGAAGLHDILLYHMAVSDVYAAGCPSGKRLTEYPEVPDQHEAHARLREALPFLNQVRNTSTSWGIRLILRDLYGWQDSVTEDNWQTLDARIRERAQDGVWHREIMQRANIRRFCTEIARREDGSDDDILHYSLEWAFFTRCQWGEYDTALYELERCWGKSPGSPAAIGGARPKPERVIEAVQDVHEAVAWYVDHIPVDRVLSTATHLSTDIGYREVSDTEMTQALERRSSAGPGERDCYASYINEAFLSALEARCGDSVVFQFSFGAEPLPFETGSRVFQRTIGQLAAMIARHPGLRFQCYLSSAHVNQSLCTLSRELPNFSLAGYWWHNFFPAIIERVIDERLDMLPLNRQVGFFSDAYCIEWAWAKVHLVKRVLARVLAKRIGAGQYNEEEAIGIARAILYETPQTLLGMRPARPM